MGAAFLIPAALSAAGGAANFINQRNANSRGQAAETQAIENQNAYRTKAMNDVAQTTADVRNSSPTPIANQEDTNFVNTLRKNAAANTSSNGPTSALGPVPGANSRYGAGVSAGTTANEAYGNKQAGDMSAMDAAVRQRQNEALSMQTLNTTLNGIGAASQSQNFVDQLRAQAVSQPNPWVSMFSNVMGGAANTMAKNNWFAPNAPKIYGASAGASPVG